jgi:hypothetical protein
MSIGNQQAFPQERIIGHGCRVPAEGMTYRQWLIGQIAACYAANIEAFQHKPGDVAAYTVQQADALIAMLDKEAAK